MHRNNKTPPQQEIIHVTKLKKFPYKEDTNLFACLFVRACPQVCVCVCEEWTMSSVNNTETQSLLSEQNQLSPPVYSAASYQEPEGGGHS